MEQIKLSIPCNQRAFTFLIYYAWHAKSEGVRSGIFKYFIAFVDFDCIIYWFPDNIYIIIAIWIAVPFSGKQYTVPRVLEKNSGTTERVRFFQDQVIERLFNEVALKFIRNGRNLLQCLEHYRISQSGFPCRQVALIRVWNERSR